MSDRADTAGTAFWEDADDTEARERYQTLVNAIDDGIYQLDAEGRVVAVNDVIVELTGYAREELLGEHVSVLLDDEDVSTAEREIERLRTNPAGRSELLECTVRTAEDEHVPCEVRMNRLETGDTVGIVRDITGQNRMIEEDRESEQQRERTLERYERIVENLPVGVYRNTPGSDGEFVAGNSTLASIFDADSVDELLDHDVSDLYADPDQRAEFSRQLAQEGMIEDFELEQETLAGDTIWISVTAIRTEEGGEVYFDGIVQDVTERRKREQKIEARSAAMERSIDGMAILDENAEYVFVNQAHADVYGYDDPAALLGETWQVCYDDEEIDRLEAEAMPALSAAGSWRGEATGLRTDGSTFPQELSLTMLDDGRYVCVVRDVTERSERERELKRYETLFTESRDVNGVLEPDGTFQYVTPSATGVLGYEQDELVGESAFDYVHPEDRERVAETYAEMVENPQQEPTVEYRFEHADGSWIVLESRGRNLLDDPEIEGIVVYTRDVTERKRREQEHQRVVQALEAAREGISLLDEDSEFIYVNDAYADTFGYDPEEMIGEHWDALGIEADPDHFHDEILPRVATEGQWAGTTTCVRSDDSTFPAQHSLTATDDDDLICVVNDISDRKRRKDELRTTKEKYQRLVEQNLVGIYIIQNGAVKYVNSRFAEIFGYSPEEMVGTPATEFVAEHDLERIVEMFREREQDDENLRYEVTGKRKDGDSVEAEAHSGPIEYEGEHAIMGTLVDITERKERERELEQHERIIETIDDGVYAIDEDSNFIMANGAFCEMVGWEREELLGRHATTVYDDDVAPTAAEKVAEITAGNNEVATLELTLHTKDGDTIPVESRFGPFPYGDGSGRCGVVRNISDRLERERALRESERRYRTLAENFPNGGVGVYDEDLRYTLVTGTMWDDIEPDAADLEGETIWDALPPDTADDVEPIFRDALEGKTGSVVSTLGGRTYRVWATPLRDAEGEITAGQSFALDINERVERERRLEELVDRLEESNERLEQFAYAASHDLQEPLRMVSSYLRLIERRYADDLDEDGREFIEFAVDGADRMRDMIEGLLKYSRVDTRGDPFEPVDLNDVLADVREDLQMRIEESDADIAVDSLPHVEGDEGQLRQVFQNLLDNAIEYSGDEPPQVEISAKRDEVVWVVSVSDEGVGIDPDDADRVFEVFQSLHSPDDHSGTGIGLALCKRIVERHGGEIWVDSEPSEGSVFSFTMPADGGHDE